MNGVLGVAWAAGLAFLCSACASVGGCPDRYAYCEGNVRHYCVSHQGSVVPDFSVQWETQDCGAEPGGLRCVEEGPDAICQ